MPSQPACFHGECDLALLHPSPDLVPGAARCRCIAVLDHHSDRLLLGEHQCCRIGHITTKIARLGTPPGVSLPFMAHRLDLPGVTTEYGRPILSTIGVEDEAIAEAWGYGQQALRSDEGCEDQQLV